MNDEFLDYKMEMMWVIGKQVIDITDFETADEKGEHWKICINNGMVRRRTVFQVPKDAFTLGLIEKGILVEANPNMIAQSRISKNIWSYMQRMSYPDVSVIGDRLSVISNQLKLGFISEKDQDHFAKPILKYLQDKVEVKIYYNLTEAEINKICDWADIVWVEWAHTAAEQVLRFERSCKVLIRLHRYELKYVDRLNWDNCHFVWFVNRDVMKQFGRKFLQVPKPKLFYLPNAVDVSEIEFSDQRFGKKLLAYSPRFTPLKNYYYAIKLLELLNRKSDGFSLTIKADVSCCPDYYNFCQRYIEQRNLAVKIISDQVTLDDIHSKKIANELLKNADIILSVSNYECFHYAFAEGLAAGCFGFCRGDREGRPQDFWEPYLCDDMNDMSEWIIDFVESKDEEKQRIANRNRKYIEDRFSPERIGNRLIDCLVLNGIGIPPNPPSLKGKICPKVGIVIPTFNHAHFLQEALDTILAGKYQNIVVLVIDDGSEDNTLEILEGYRDRIYYLANDHLGSHVQRDIGLRIMKELGVDYVSFPCADDIYYKNWIHDMVAEAERTNALVVYPRFNYLDQESGKTVNSLAFYPHDKEVLLNERCYICDHCLVSREVFDNLGWKLNWQEFGAYCFFDLWVRLTENEETNKRIIGLNKVLWKYRRYAESLSVTKADGRPNDLKEKVLRAYYRRINSKCQKINFKQVSNPNIQIPKYEEFEVGGSRHKFIKIADDWKVIEIGGGANPCPRADVITNFNSELHQRGKKVKVPDDVKMVECDVQDMACFADKEFDYSICCHVLEHVDDPVKACDEIMRISERGYIECPSGIAEMLLGHDVHQWVVLRKHNRLIFRRKRPEECNRFGDFFKDLFYKDNPAREKFIETWFRYWSYGYVCFEWIDFFKVEVR